MNEKPAMWNEIFQGKDEMNEWKTHHMKWNTSGQGWNEWMKNLPYRMKYWMKYEILAIEKWNSPR